MSISQQCQVKKYGKVLVNLLFGATKLMIALSGNIIESNILVVKSKLSRQVNVIWLNFSGIGRQVIFQTWD